jgi:hypothetical protein
MIAAIYARKSTEQTGVSETDRDHCLTSHFTPSPDCPSLRE